MKDSSKDGQAKSPHAGSLPTKPSIVANAAIAVMLVAAIAVLAMNQFAIADLTGSVKITGAAAVAESQFSAVTGPDVIPTGIPPVYGKELGVSYDDVSASDQQKADATIRKLALQDVNIKLSGEQLNRYIGIAGEISCEYCCGAPSVIFTEDAGDNKAGDAACGCSHSYAMRGVAKYLITRHGSEFSDNEILEEMGKWKMLFFPGAITQKASILQQRGIELNYINLASNAYRGLESDSGASGGMVGGC